MLPGQTTPLSPKEEITLRRVALGLVPSEDLPPEHVKLLASLALVRIAGDELKLTALGQLRYDALPRPMRLDHLTRGQIIEAAKAQAVLK